MDAILDVWMPELEATSAEPAEGTVLDALFNTSTAPPPPPFEHAKRHRSRDSEEGRARKKESNEMKAAGRASLVDEDAQL